MLNTILCVAVFLNWFDLQIGIGYTWEMGLESLMLKRADKLLVRKFNHSHMSNAKWRKAFAVLSSPGLDIGLGYWKFVDDDRLFEYPIPTETFLGDSYIYDGPIPPIEYKYIEWIEFPSQWTRGNPPRQYAQDLNKIREALDKEGQFPLLETETGLRIYGYS